MSRLRALVSRDDRGVGLIEVLVAMMLLGLVIGLGVGGYRRLNENKVGQIDRVDVWTAMQGANGQLLRDVADGTGIRTAEAQALSISVVRDGKCQLREYKIAGGELTVGTVFYEQESCSGPSERRDQILVPSPRYTGVSTFTYYNGDDKPIAPPVQDRRNIARVGWVLMGLPNDKQSDVTLESAAAFDGRGESSGTGTPDMTGTSAFLEVVTGTTGVEGRDKPVLRWTDASPTVTAGWQVFRLANPEGMVSGTAGFTSWQQVTWLGDPTTTTWTDAALPAGYTASYTVRATLKDGGLGQGSNTVVTGIRPATVTDVTATGQETSIKIDWAAAVGATGYDVYRDGALAAQLGAVVTFTDGVGQSGWTGTGYGHSHNYRVVAVNRWEQRMTTGSQTDRVPFGALDSKVDYAGGARLLSTSTADDGAFTAPAAPALTATPNSNWTNTVGRSYASWIGTGPTTKGTARDRGWVTEVAPLNGVWGALWSETTAASQVHSARPAGATTQYRSQTCNSSGCSPWSTVASALQRPPAPTSCTVDSATTRSLRVTTNPAVMESAATSYRVNGWYEGASTQITADPLGHGQTHTFGTHTRNASPANDGWSDETRCSGATVTLATPSISVSGITTRGADSSGSASNGSGVTTSISGGAASRNDLADNTAYTATANNTDGHNNVGNSTTFRTVLLTQPSCSVSGGGVAPATVTVTTSGSNGTRQARVGAGAWASPNTSATMDAGEHAGSARATDGLNYTSTVGCGSVTVTAPAPTWVSNQPNSCSGASVATIKTAWLSGNGSTHFTPSPFTVQWKLHDGKTDSGYWRVYAENRNTTQMDWTTGTWTCGGNTGV